MIKQDSAFPANMNLGKQAQGLTKRELFAAMAMQALVSRPILLEPRVVAIDSVTYADALIEQLNRGEG